VDVFSCPDVHVYWMLHNIAKFEGFYRSRFYACLYTIKYISYSLSILPHSVSSGAGIAFRL